MNLIQNKIEFYAVVDGIANRIKFDFSGDNVAVTIEQYALPKSMWRIKSAYHWGAIDSILKTEAAEYVQWHIDAGEDNEASEKWLAIKEAVIGDPSFVDAGISDDRRS